MKKDTLKNDFKSWFNMAKWIFAIGIIGIVILLLFSCQKEITPAPVVTSVNQTTTKDKSTTITTEAYNSRYYDSCRKENIILTGSVTYTIKLVTDTSARLYFSYDINFTATGIGEITGHIFKGGITQKATLRISSDGDSKASVNYKLRFVGENGEQITFTEVIKFISIDGETKLLFSSFSDSCK